MQLTIAIGQLRPKKGDYDDNLNRLGDVFSQLGRLNPRPDVLVLPETFTSGYFVEGGVREVARSAGVLAADLEMTYRNACGNDVFPLDIALGFYECYRDRFYNSALYATLGARAHNPTPNTQHPAPIVRHVHRKIFLPTYGVFDEARFVEAGHHVAAFDTAYGRAALLVCEDAWHSLSGTIAALDGAQVVFVLSASPARGTGGPRPGNVDHWEDLMRRIADEHGVYAVLAQLVGFEGGKGFPGGSLVLGPRGDVRVTGPIWSEALVTATIDLDDLPLARADLPLLADLETMLPHLERELDRAQRGEPVHLGWDAARDQKARRPDDQERGRTGSSPRASTSADLPVYTPVPFDPAADFLRLDSELTRTWLVEFLRDEVRRRRGFSGVVVALSGGVDSALTTYLCAEALGPHNVTAVRMPYRTSSAESLEHAQLVIDALGVQSVTVDISDAVDGYSRIDPTIDGRRKGNVMARMRMIVLFDVSQKLGVIPIGTGNKTERLFGYYTWHADDSPPVNPLGDLFKSQVWQLARHVGVPEVIVAKPASADLIVGQTDEADFGIAYPQADRILHFLLHGYAPERITALGFSPAEVALVKRRLDSTHWKRHLPSTAMLSPTAIGEYYLRPLDY
jgi:NAD+ synthetase